MTDGSLFSGLFARGAAAAQTGDRALLQAMLDVEVALVRALARAGLAPESIAEEVAAAADAEAFDVAEIGRTAAEKGTPVPGMLDALRSRVSESARGHLHRGATSQDVVDTALMLVARRALGPVEADLRAAADVCAELARRHRRTLIPGRTLLQQALPTTFGLKAAGWLTGLDAAERELAEVRERTLALQLGGAVGTLAALGGRGLEVAEDVAGELGLVVPELPWHTMRARPARLASALGATLGVLGKIARDVTLLAQTEVAEVAEGGGEGRGGSSTMPHKRNPVGAVAVLACAQRGPGLVATILGSMVQEHERAGGAWQAESEPLLELLRLTGSAASAARELLAGIEVDERRMRGDLELTGGLVMSESVASALAGSIGMAAAQEVVEGAARSVREGRSFREALLEKPGVAESLGPAGVDEALDPARYLGVCDELIERALAAHRRGDDEQEAR